MALARVNLASDVFFVCLNHALSTEGEEIVGLLVGEVDENKVAHVSAVLILRRSDKRKDRVEISPEQLSSASTEAERLSIILKKPVRVVGWYHSHPKLNVLPSTIDVDTQDGYQLMDIGFIGMIFSVFNEDQSKKGGQIQMTCFQAETVIEDGNVEKRRLDIPVHIVHTNYVSHVCMAALIHLPRSVCQEEQVAYQLTNQVPLDYLTRLHNSTMYTRALGEVAEVISAPLLKMLEEKILNNELKRKKLQSKKKELTALMEQLRIEKANSQIYRVSLPSPPASSSGTSGNESHASTSGNEPAGVATSDIATSGTSGNEPLSVEIAEKQILSQSADVLRATHAAINTKSVQIKRKSDAIEPYNNGETNAIAMLIGEKSESPETDLSPKPINAETVYTCTPSTNSNTEIEVSMQPSYVDLATEVTSIKNEISGAVNSPRGKSFAIEKDLSLKKV